MAKIQFPGGGLCFKLVRTSLMFHSTVSALTSFVILSVTHMIDTYWALILPAFATSLGLYLMKQHMDGSIASAVLESARLDGANEFRIYLTIAMPMVKPACLTLIINTFQSLWNSASSVYIYSEQLKSFNYALQQLSTSGVRYAGVQAAGTVIMMAVPILVFVISQSNIMETMASSGMKD
jgi:ABC-type glycerol-3-phosphate transport system permease component